MSGGRYLCIGQACGSGGTAAGLALGARLSGAAMRVHAFGVCDDEAYFYDFINQLLAEAGVPPDVTGEQPVSSGVASPHA